MSIAEGQLSEDRIKLLVAREIQQALASEEENGWGKHRIYVTKELERIGRAIGDLIAEVQQMHRDQEVLKFKYGLWSATATALTMILYTIASKLLKVSP